MDNTCGGNRGGLCVRVWTHVELHYISPRLPHPKPTRGSILKVRQYCIPCILWNYAICFYYYYNNLDAFTDISLKIPRVF